MPRNNPLRNEDKTIFEKMVADELTIWQMADKIGNCTAKQVSWFLKKNNLKTIYTYGKIEYDKDGIPIQYCRCGIRLSEDNAFWNKKKNKWQYCCKKCRSKDSSERWQYNKQRAINYKGGKCQKCGYDKCLDVLEFHHINPEEKVSNFKNIKITCWESQKKELDKCILLCANCHRETHYELRKQIK